MLCTVAFGLVFGTAGWQRGETVRRRRKAAGIPTVDTAHMRLHDCFNLLTLVRLPPCRDMIMPPCRPGALPPCHRPQVCARSTAVRCSQPVIIVMGACVMFDYLGLPSGQQVGLPVDAHVYTLIFSLYVAVDLVYVWAIPESTPQPGVILVHHVSARLRLSQFAPRLALALALALALRTLTACCARACAGGYLDDGPLSAA
jgi:hypothetical protein